MKKKIIKRRQNGQDGEGERREREERILFFFIFLPFASFSDLRKSDRRFSSGLKAKLIYAMRAMRGHQKVGVLTNSMR